MIARIIRPMLRLAFLRLPLGMWTRLPMRDGLEKGVSGGVAGGFYAVYELNVTLWLIVNVVPSGLTNVRVTVGMIFWPVAGNLA